MKKSLILVGMLAVGYANAQEGNVGINTEEPRATLEIVPEKNNLNGTTNEGILIPRLTKARVIAIADAKLVEGTKVYVTDEVLESDSDKFQGTGKGFYYYSGIKWVKLLDTDTNTNDDIWVRDGVDARLDYPKSDYTTKYMSNGGYQLYNTKDVEFPIIPSQNSRLAKNISILENVNAFNKHIYNTSSIDVVNSDSDELVGQYYVYKVDKNSSPTGSQFHTTIDKDGIMAGKPLRGIFNVAEHHGNTKVNYIDGIYSSAALNGLSSSAGTVTGGVFDAVTNSNESVDELQGVRGRIRLNGTGPIQNLVGVKSEILLRSGRPSGEYVSSNIGTLTGVNISYNGVLYDDNYTGTIDTIYDIYSQSGNYAGIKGRIKNHYGIYITGTQKINYLAGKLGITTNKPIAHLDVVNNSAQIAGRYFHRTTTSESIAANIKKIITVRDIMTDSQGAITDGGTKLEKPRTYEIVLNSVSEAVHTGSKYIVYFDNLKKEWISKLVSSAGNNSSIKLGIAPSGDEIEIWHEEFATTFILRANIVSIQNYSGTGTSAYNFGLDGAMTNLGGNVGVGTETPTEKLDVEGNIRSANLAGTGNRNVYADENGVLRAGEASTGATTLTGEAALECNASNRGKMNFIQGEDGKSDIFGICMKNKDGNYYWGYMVGGNNPTNGTGAFGSGL